MLTSFTGTFELGRRRSSPPPIYSFSSFTFTTGGITGRTGPSKATLLSSYDTVTYSWLSNTAYFNMLTNGIQLWTVPKTGLYRITAKGAQGAPTQASAGGRGAIIIGEFNLTVQEKLQILVGQTTSVASGRLYRSSSGGGASWVVKYTEIGNPSSNVVADILIVAGGGAGTGSTPILSASDASVTTSGNTAASGSLKGAGGTGGNGGGASAGATANGAGGGFLTDGGSNGGSAGGRSWKNGGLGGDTNATYAPLGGGFGGGGAVNNGDFNRFSGGGGYSGGGASDTGTSSAQSSAGGGGGGSYNAGSNQSSSSGASGNFGGGSVLIEFLS